MFGPALGHFWLNELGSPGKLDAYFSPKKNVDYEVFQQAVQQPGEIMDQFAMRLRKTANN